MDILVADGTKSERTGIKRILAHLNQCQSEFSFRYAPLHSTLALEEGEFIPRAIVAEIPSHIQSRQAASFWMAIVDSPLEDNWFSFVDKAAASSVITTHSWNLLSHLPIESFIGIEIIVNLQRLLVGWDDFSYVHEHPLGCINDLCGYKPDLILKMRTADVCPMCMETWAKTLSLEQVAALREAMEIVRQIALGRVKGIELPIEERAAFPVAVIWRLLRQETNPAIRFTRLLDLFDISVRFSVIHLSSECVRLEAITGEIPKELKLGLREHPTLGNWADALRQATEWLEAHSGSAAISVSTLIAAEKASHAIAKQELVNLRNETRGHAYTLPQRDYEQLFQMRLPHVTEVIDNLQGLLFCDLSCVKDLRYEAPGRFQVGVLSLVGSNPIFAFVSRKSPAALLEKHVVIFRDDSIPSLDLHPFVLLCECPQCHHERVLVMDDESRYLDPQVGHRVTLATD